MLRNLIYRMVIMISAVDTYYEARDVALPVSDQSEDGGMINGQNAFTGKI